MDDKHASSLLDEYESLVPKPRKSRKGVLTRTSTPRDQAVAGRAQAIARRLLIERHHAEYDDLYRRVKIELEQRGDEGDANAD